MDQKVNPNPAIPIANLIEKKYNENNKLLFENQVEREWLTTKEAAHFLGLSENALRIMVHRNQIQVYKFGGKSARRLRFRIRDCQALFLKKGA
jgi:excisionase family DNA binding protein